MPLAIVLAAARILDHTSAGIATRLLMSRGTVKTHLSRAYGKLGATGRTQLIVLASEGESPV